jgi:3'(2'), 5'-bisphosphate nucleotidase
MASGSAPSGAGAGAGFGGDDARLARLLAEQAGRVLVEVRSSGLSGAALRAAGDAAAHRLLATRLAELRPGDAVLSEEGTRRVAVADAGDPRGRRRVWIVDPLDGTREFGEPGRTDWAVHVALWQDGRLAAGAVALPAVNLSFGTDVPPSPPPRPPGPPRLAVSRSRPPAFVPALAEALGAELVPLGSAGVKCAAVWQGLADVYVHAGGQHIWDSAAPVAVARAAGLHTSRTDGSPLDYDPGEPSLPDLLVCRPELAGAVLAALGGTPSRDGGPRPTPQEAR